jgi:hypothetical protein
MISGRRGRFQTVSKRLRKMVAVASNPRVRHWLKWECLIAMSRKCGRNWIAGVTFFGSEKSRHIQGVIPPARSRNVGWWTG